MSAVWGGHSSPPPQTPPCALEGGAHTLFHHRLSVWGVGGTRERERQLGVQPPHPNCPPAPQSPPPPQHPPGGVPASHEAEAGLPPGGAADAEGQDTPRRWIWGGPCGGGGTSKSWDTHTHPPPKTGRTPPPPIPRQVRAAQVDLEGALSCTIAFWGGPGLCYSVWEGGTESVPLHLRGLWAVAL